MRLDGRGRTLQIGSETYSLSDDRTFVVQFDANLEATVAQTDAAMRDVLLSAEDRELIEQSLSIFVSLVTAHIEVGVCGQE